MTIMDLSISIVSYNVKGHLRRCLKSIYDTVDNLSFEVTVVDNNSNDETTQMLKNEFPSVKLIENKENLGFPAANNQAIKQTRAKYILLLNPDTVILPGTIEGMVHFMDARPEAGISGCRKVDQNGNPDSLDLFIRKYEPFSLKFHKFLKRAILDYYSGLFQNSKIIKNNIFNINISRLDFNLYKKNKPVEVDVVWGSFMLIRKRVVKQVGEFDERFFFTGEDDDFCYRTKGNGWKIYYCPQYKIVHLCKRSINQWSKKNEIDVKTYSRFIFYSKHKGKIWVFFKVFKIISAKIIATGIFLIFGFIHLMKRTKNKIDWNLYLSTIPIDIRNLFRVIFNISPQFRRY